MRCNDQTIEEDNCSSTLTQTYFTAETDVSSQDTLSVSALQELPDSLGHCLEQVLRPLTLPISRDAFHAVILEIRREVDELAACHPIGDVYVESVAITQPDGRSVDLEIVDWLSAAVE